MYNIVCRLVDEFDIGGLRFKYVIFADDQGIIIITGNELQRMLKGLHETAKKYDIKCM